MSAPTRQGRQRRGARFAFWALTAALLLPPCVMGNDQGIDLDQLTQAALDAALAAELGPDDLLQFGIDVDEAYPLKTLHAAILRAFSDEGDDEDEQVITSADLNDEMDEADTDLATVVWNALQRADNVASAQPASFYLRVVAGTLARRDGLTIGGVGATQSKVEVRNTITRIR